MELPAVAGQKPPGQLALQPESIALFCLDPKMAALATRLSQALPLTAFQPDVQAPEAVCREAFATYSVVIFLGPAVLPVETLSALVDESATRPVVLTLNSLKPPVVQQWPTGARKASAMIHFLTAFAMSGEPATGKRG